MPNEVLWREAQDRSFRTLKDKLCCEPVLRLPDMLRTDASDVGLSAILLQEFDGLTVNPAALTRTNRLLSS